MDLQNVYTHGLLNLTEMKLLKLIPQFWLFAVDQKFVNLSAALWTVLVEMQHQHSLRSIQLYMCMHRNSTSVDNSGDW